MLSLVLGAATFEFGALQLRRSMNEDGKTPFELEIEAKAATLHRIKRMVKAGEAMTLDELKMLCRQLNATLEVKRADV